MKNGRNYNVSAMWVLAMVLLPIATCAQVTLLDLGTLGGSSSEAVKVNEQGHVLGSSYTSGNAAQSAFVFDGVSMRPLGLGGSWSEPVDINASGRCIGNALTAAGRQSAFFDDGSSTRELSLGGGFSVAADLSDSGFVTGHAELPNEEIHAFLFDASSSALSDLGTLGGAFSQAFKVNESGEAIGISFTADGALRAFLWSNGQMRDLTPDSIFSWPLDINDRGQVAGWMMNPETFETHAFLYDGNSTQDLGTLGGFYSAAFDLTDSGYVAGESELPNGDIAGFLYRDGQMIALSLGGSYATALKVNEAGMVAGESYTQGGEKYLPFLYDGFGLLAVAQDRARGLFHDMNERGDMAGEAWDASGNPTGFLFTGGTLHWLSLGGSASAALDVNESGIAAGSSRLPGDAVQHAFITQSADREPPVTTASVSPEPGPFGWHNGPAIVHLQASDRDGSGVREISFSINGASPQTTAGDSAEIHLVQSGIWTVRYFATDLAGNQEDPRELTVRIDLDAPGVTAAADRTTLWPPNGKMTPVRISGRMTDALSGLRLAGYRVIDEYGVNQSSGNITVDADGRYAFTVMLCANRNANDRDGRTYRICVQGTDFAGNRAEAMVDVVVPQNSP